MKAHIQDRVAHVRLFVYIRRNTNVELIWSDLTCVCVQFYYTVEFEILSEIQKFKQLDWNMHMNRAETE